MVRLSCVHHQLQCKVLQVAHQTHTKLATLVLEEWNSFLPIKGKAEILAASTEGGIHCSRKKGPPDICRAMACPVFQNTFRWLPVIMNHLEISPYPSKVLRQYIHLAVVLHLGSRNPRCSLNVRESNSTFSREEESIWLEKDEACCSQPIQWWHTRQCSQKHPRAGDVKSCQP